MISLMKWNTPFGTVRQTTSADAELYTENSVQVPENNTTRV